MIDYKQHIADCDLDFSSGDLQLTESTDQHQRDLILAQKGHLRDRADRGVGAVNYLLDNHRENFLRAVRKELAADGMAVILVKENETMQIIVDANYP